MKSKPSTVCNFFISALAHHDLMTASVDHRIGDTTSVESAILAGFISNVASAILQTFTFNENNKNAQKP